MKLEGLYFPLGACLISMIIISFLLDLGIYEIPLLAIPLLSLLFLLSDRALKIRVPRLELILALIPQIFLPLSLLSPPPLNAISCMIFLFLMFLPLSPLISKDLWEALSLSAAMGGLFISLLFAINFLYRIPIFEIIVIISVSMSIISIYLSTKRKIFVENEFKLNGYHALISILSAFFLLELALAYPNIFRYTTNDLLYHQDQAWYLANFPSKYNAWNYLGYNSLLGATYLITKADVLSLMLTVVAINLFSFLIVASSFSKLEWRKESLFAWSLLTGLGWIAALKFGTDYNGLDKANEASYRSLIWSQPIFFWGLPLTLAIALLAFLLYSDIFVEGRRKIFIIFVLSTLTFLVHVAESLLFVAYLSLASLIFGKRRESSIAVLLSGASVYLLSFIHGPPSIYGGPGLYLLASPIPLLLNELRRFLRVERLIGLMSSKRDIIISILMALFASGLIVWILHLGEIKVSEIYYIGQVPWFFYPALLGVSGLLGIASLKILREPLHNYALFALACLILGRLITYVKISGFMINYWEYRFPLYALLGVSVLSSPIIRILVRRRDSKLYALILALILFSGFSSTALSVQRWNQLNVTASGSILPADFDFAVKFKGENDATMLLLSYYSSAVSSLMHSNSMRQLAPWISEGPEIPLLTLYELVGKRNISVLTTMGDVAILSGENSTYNYLFMFMGPILSAPSVERIEIGNPALPNATLPIIMPSDVYFRRRSLIAYELMRDELPFHTIYLSDDPRAPSGIYIGPSSSNQSVEEELPSDRGDLRWLYLRGDFSPDESGIRVRGSRNLAITTYELDKGEFKLKVCGEGGYVGIIYDFKNFANYRIFQLYLDSGTAVNRIIRGRNVSSGPSFIVPLSWECNELELRLGKELEAVVNGRAIKLPGVEKLGVLGFETGNFTGVISGKASGYHSLEWNPKNGSILIGVSGGGIDIKDWVDRGLRNLSDAKKHFPGLKLDLKSEYQEVPRIEAVITGLEASGKIRVIGRPTSLNEAPMNSSTIRINASRLAYLGGKGFYADLLLDGVEGMNSSRVKMRFRTPLTIEAEGIVKLERYHTFSRSISYTFNVNLTEANLTILAADRAILLSKLDAPKEEVSTRKLLYKSFDESRYLAESLTSFLALSIAFYYLMRKIEGPKKVSKRKNI
jgi:hypothetical protein